jgi:hypothetical protein
VLGGFQELSENCELLSLSVDAFSLFSFFLPTPLFSLYLSLSHFTHSFILSLPLHSQIGALESFGGEHFELICISRTDCIADVVVAFQAHIFILLVGCEVRTLNQTIFYHLTNPHLNI